MERLRNPILLYANMENAECPRRWHSGIVYAVEYSPDGTMLATASGDGTARIWDSLPPAQLRSKVLQAEKRQRAVAPLVDKRLNMLGDPLDMADHIRADESLSEEVLRASLWELLER